MTILIVILAVIILCIVGTILFFKFCYTVLPPNVALIVNGQKVYFSNAVTMPSDKKLLIPLESTQIRMSYTGAQGVLCKEQLLLDISIMYQICVGLDGDAILKAAAKVGAENLGNKEKVTTAIDNVLTNTLKTIVAELPYDVVDKDRGKLRKQLMSSLHDKLYGYHLDYLDIEQIKLTSLESLAQQDEALFKQQELIREDWDRYQRQQLENRLKLVTDRQLELSTKIKALIADYQRVIRQKINVFINKTY